MQSVLSYFREYFDPTGSAPLANHSTGQIAQHLHRLLARSGPVAYLDDRDRPCGLAADLYVGHFWAFAEIAAANDFATQIAFYPVSDPSETRRLLCGLADDFGVPAPLWDLPPPSFDHERTMELADLVLVTGNSYTMSTFPARWRAKLRLVNYSVDAGVFGRQMAVERRGDLCYVATHCGLRKGFLDVLRVWETVAAGGARLHVVGRLDPPFDDLLRRHDPGSIVYHGWLDSDSDAYLRLLQACRFAYIPTWSEGQMGTLLEAVHAGCIPITTPASGLDDHVLAHAVVVQPRDLVGQRAAIEAALAWSEAACEQRRGQLRQAVQRYQTWDVFTRAVEATIEEARRAPAAAERSWGPADEARHAG